MGRRGQRRQLRRRQRRLGVGRRLLRKNMRRYRKSKIRYW